MASKWRSVWIDGRHRSRYTASHAGPSRESNMNAVERVQAVLAGRKPDHPPVSFWHHFQPDQFCGPAAVKAHLDHFESFDLDFLKVMNDNGYPHEGLIERVEQLESLEVLSGDEPRFARQLELISNLKRDLDGRVLMTTTVFNAWATLRHLVRKPGKHKPPNLDASEDVPSKRIFAFFEQNERIVRTAVATVAKSLANFVRRCLDAGADGVFMSVRDDWLQAVGGPQLYDGLLRPADREILEAAAAGSLNMLHVCGRPVDLAAFGEYPVHAINWADRAAGPSISDVIKWMKPAICGGVDNLTTLPEGGQEDCEREVRDALEQTGDRPIMISAGCTYDPQCVPKSNLEAICRAARS